MKHSALVALLAAVLLGAAPATDSRISSLVAQVSPTRLKATETKLVGFFTRNDFSETTSTTDRGVFAARDWIKSQFEEIAKTSDGRMTVALDTYLQPKTPKTPRDVTESSVIATLQGDEPGPLYIMSSHYDDCNGDCTDGPREAPGADDNGSGVAAVLEVARIMTPHRFRGTIVFITFDGEELGLWGSKHYADSLRDAGTQVAANLNNDIVGNSTGGGGAHEPNVIRLFSPNLNDSPSRELARFVGEIVPQYVRGFSVRHIFRADRFMRGGDQESFQADGFPAVRFVESNENFTHQHQDVRALGGTQFGDLLPYIDYVYLARATQANVAALAALALGPAAPLKAELVMKKLGYDSTLRWQAAPGATSYEVVWRTTDASQWQHVKNVGNVLTVTLPLSKDDYIIGVRSIDATGLRSVASYPNAVRE